jgi:zinc resistance-associated protein
MLKTTIAAGTVVLTLASAGFALAQQSSRGEHHGFRPSAEDRAAFADARIAALKAGLKLNADQEKNWPAVETAMRDLAKQRAERRADRTAQPQRGDIIERLRRGAAAMTTRGTGLKTLADAAEPLYKSLDDGQKRRFAVLLQLGRHGGHGHHHRWRRHADNGAFDGQHFGRGGGRSQERNSDQHGDD